MRRAPRPLRAAPLAAAAFAALAAPGCGEARAPRAPAPPPGRWETLFYEPFDDPSLLPEAAPWRPDDYPDDGPHADAGSYFRARGVAPPRPAYRASLPFGARGWLTLESYGRTDATPLRELAAVVPDPAGGANRALRLRSPAHSDGTVVRPSAPLPRRYRVSLRVGYAEFGDGLAGGPNGYDGGETAEPWSTKDATEQNGFYWLAITDAPTRPHNNVWVHHHRKVVVDTDNHHPPWMEIFDGARFEPGGDRPVMLFALDGAGRTHPRNGKPFLSWSAGRVQPSGAIRAVDRYLPGRWYSVRVERDDAGFVVELSGEFRHGGRRTYRAAFPFDAHCVFHYNPPGVPPRGACVDESPAPEADSPAPQWPLAGGWPDWFFFGDPHTNYYEGTAYYDDLRLEVFREGG
ncbi:MAG TPA: hypothetical protein VFS43_18760 [Polyangiaceae bacterium]|nr:hypothetical protein [Polyangiaceae bacterium]